MSLDRRRKSAILATFEDILNEIALVKKDVKWLKSLYWYGVTILTSEFGMTLWKLLHP